MRRIQLVALSLALALCLVVLAIGVGFVRRARQVRTFANLRLASELIEREVELERAASPEARIEGIVRSINKGRDSWGSPILVAVAPRSGRFSYLLVSKGADRRLDVARVRDYFAMPQVAIHGAYDADIIFRDGRPVTLAGK